MNGVVSWGELAVFLVVFLVFYYAVALLLLYRREWRVLLRRRMGPSFPMMGGAMPEQPESDGESVPDAETTASTEGAERSVAGGQDLVHELMGEFAVIVRGGVAAGITRPDLEGALRELLGQYGALKEHKSFEELVRYILAEVDTKLSHKLSDAEVRALWGVGV